MQRMSAATLSPGRLFVAAWLGCAVACPLAMGDDAAVVQRLESLAAQIEFGADGGRRVTGVVIPDGSKATAADVAACGTLTGLRKLQIYNCRTLDDAAVQGLVGLQSLDTLALTNTALTDAAVETIATAFPNLVDLDLSSNTNMTGAAMKWIAGLEKLQRLGLLQNRFNDLNTRRLGKLKEIGRAHV